MKASTSLGAIAALTLSAAASAEITTTTVELGTFSNTSPGSIDYSGSFASNISSHPVQGAGTTVHTVIDIDLLGVLQSVGANAIYSVTITDTGVNAYGSLSPGADIDLFTFHSLPNGATWDIVYDGPNPVHLNEDPNRWDLRVSELDSFSGAQDAYHLTHLSLGDHGSVTAFLSTLMEPGNPGDPGDPGRSGGSPGIGFDFPAVAGLAGIGPMLQISEHGYTESFTVTMEVFTVVPGPGSLALLAVAGLIGRRRRA